MRRARSTRKSIVDGTGVLAVVLAATLLLAACVDGTRADTDTWEIEGPLLAWEAGIWIVDAVPIVVPGDIALNENLILGSTVTASGVFDDAGLRVADEVHLRAGTLPESTLAEINLTGTIERIDSNLWSVDGREVVVPTGTPIRSTDPGDDIGLLLQIGTVAEIAGNQLADERILAREITLRPAPEAVQPAPADQTGIDQDQPQQPTPAPPTSDDGQADEGGDDGDGDDGEQRENTDDDDDDDDKQDKPEKPDKPDKDGDGDTKRKP